MKIDRCVKPIIGAKPNAEGLPYATHEGVMKIGEIELDVYVLNTGERIISTESLKRLLGEDFLDNLKFKPE